jgi:proteic killer suppression protein
MIKSFKDKETAKVYSREGSNKLPWDIQQAALRKLRMIHNSTTLNDLKVPPSNRLENLKGDRQGQMSIRINARWRICFKWRHGNAEEVEITDYH